MARQLIISSSPHWRDNESIAKIMFTVIAVLIPSWLFSIYLYGFPAFYLTTLAILSAVLSEYIVQKIFHIPVSIGDGSAALTGLLLAFNLPPGVPFWIPIVGSFFAIIVGKIIFGGLGNNPLNPALVGRVFLMASWPVEMTSLWLEPKRSTLSGLSGMLEGMTQATPLSLYKTSLDILANNPIPKIEYSAQTTINHLSTNYQSLLIGNVGGCIGETSAILLFIGAMFLIYKHYIDWVVPFTFIFTASFLGWVFGGYQVIFSGDFVFHALSGGLFLGAFYMATDMVTSPITRKGRLVFAIGCGLLTALIRIKGGYPEGVSYSILLMNLAVPLIDRYTIPRKFGEVKNENV